LRVLRTRGHTPGAETAVARFSRLGEHGLGWHALALAGAALDPPRRPLYVRAMKVTAAAFLANQAVKLVVRRRRPQLEDLPPLMGTMSNRSYPSAHATTSFAAAATLPLPAGPLFALATAMTLSRVYLGLHYPSDSMAGAALGGAVAALAP
jgi:membrane-associated phospholipid phosphatase